jgi:hypothetical protein
MELWLGDRVGEQGIANFGNMFLSAGSALVVAGNLTTATLGPGAGEECASNAREDPQRPHALRTHLQNLDI